jgi:hypothetical protein
MFLMSTKSLMWTFELHFSVLRYGAVVVCGESVAYSTVDMCVLCHFTGDYCELVSTRLILAILSCFARFLSVDRYFSLSQKTDNSGDNLSFSRFGGLVVSVLAPNIQVLWFKPDRSRLDF